MAFDGFNLPPESLKFGETEKVILGAILLDNGLINQTKPLAVTDFLSPFHRAVFSAMLELSEESRKIDPITIFEILKHDSQNEKELWAVSAITNLTHGLPHFSDIYEYVEMVKSVAIKRESLKTLEKIAVDLSRNKLSLKDFCVKLNTLENSLRENAPEETDSFKTLSEVMNLEIQPVLDSYFKSEPSRYLISSGFPSIDEKIGGGYYLSDFVAIVAPPKSAKSAFALQSALKMAKRGETVGLLSLEMSNLQNALRLIAQESYEIQKQTGDENDLLSTTAIRPGMWDFTYKKASAITSSLFLDNFLLCQKPLEFKELQTEVRRLVKEKNLRVLIVDYWQLVENSNNKNNRAERLAEIAKGLKKLGQELNIVVIALGQFNQEGLKLREHKKELSTLYLEGSGELVKSANIVLTIDIEDADLFDSAAPRRGTLTFKPLRSSADAKLDCLFFGKYLTVEVI